MAGITLDTANINSDTSSNWCDDKIYNDNCNAIEEEQRYIDVDEEMSKDALEEIANEKELNFTTNPNLSSDMTGSLPQALLNRPVVPVRTSSRSTSKGTGPVELNDGDVSQANVPLSMEEISDMYPDIAKHKIFQLAGDDLSGRPVIVFSMSKLPPRTDIDHQKLLEFMKCLMDQYVESDYSIVYFHYGLNSRNKPSLKWLLQVYSDMDRKYKKNLKAFFIVHPSNFIKIVSKIFSPFISKKFGRKINYVNRLDELVNHVRLEQLDIPKEVKDYNHKISSASVFHAKLPVKSEDSKNHQFGVRIDVLRERSGEAIPIAVRSAIEFIVDNALDVEGIFRRSAPANVLNEAVNTFNKGLNVEFSMEQVHLAPALLKKFLRDLPEPLLTFELYDKIMESCSLPEEERLAFTYNMLNEMLAKDNRIILVYLLQFLQQVIDHSSNNRMNSGSLAIVFGPNLLWSKNEASTLTSMSKINTFSKYIIDNSKHIFDESSA